jgi:hypothetical protein
MSENLPIGRQEFTVGDMNYVYDEELVTMEMAWNASAVLDFHIDQKNNPADTFDKVLSSGGLEWFHKCASSLLTRIIDGEPTRFTPMSWREAELFVRNLPHKEYKRLKDCIEDFFTSSGNAHLFSQAFIAKSNSIAVKIISDLVAKRMADK